MGAVIALGPASAAFADFADVGPIDETGGYGPGAPAKKSTPPGKVSEQSAPRTPRTSQGPATPQKPAVPQAPQKPAVPQAPKTTTVPETPKKSEIPPAPKKPDVAIGEASFYATGDSVVPPKPAVDAGRVSAKGTKITPRKPTPAEGKVAAQRADIPRTTVIKVPAAPEQTVTKQGGPGRSGEQLPAGAPKTGIGTSAGMGLDSAPMAAGAAALLVGFGLAGFGMARRRQVVAFRRYN